MCPGGDVISVNKMSLIMMEILSTDMISQCLFQRHATALETSARVPDRTKNIELFSCGMRGVIIQESEKFYGCLNKYLQGGECPQKKQRLQNIRGKRAAEDRRWVTGSHEKTTLASAYLTNEKGRD